MSNPKPNARLVVEVPPEMKAALTDIAQQEFTNLGSVVRQILHKDLRVKGRMSAGEGAE